MPPKVKITKDDILNAAMEISVQNGIHAITAKGVAEKLSSSVIPIYSNFENIDHLKQEVVNVAKGIAQKFMQRKYTNTPFLNMGIGSLLFSIEYGQLYKSVLHDDLLFQNNMHLMAVGAMSKDELFSGLSQLDLIKIYKRVRICTIGLFLSASLTSDNQEIMRIIDELVVMTNDLVNGERVRKNLHVKNILVTNREKDDIERILNNDKNKAKNNTQS